MCNVRRDSIEAHLLAVWELADSALVTLGGCEPLFVLWPESGLRRTRVNIQVVEGCGHE